MRVIYSRNKRERQKQRLRSLESEYSDLQLENRSLKAENSRLESLAEAAIKEINFHQQSMNLRMPTVTQAAPQQDSVAPFASTFSLAAMSNLAQSQATGRAGVGQSILSPTFQYALHAPRATQNTLPSDDQQFRVAALLGLQRRGQHLGLPTQFLQAPTHLPGAFQLDLQHLRQSEGRPNPSGAAVHIAESTRMQQSSNRGGAKAGTKKGTPGQFECH